MKTTRRFWPLDFDQEVAIYDNPSWDLPGFKRRRHHKDRPAFPKP
jgi:hypothetical protein